jgi:hypothetical protein
MNTESVSTLAKLGLMDPLEAIESIINAMQPADLIRMRVRSKVGSMVDERIAAAKRKVKRTLIKELEAWHLKFGDREIIAKAKLSDGWRTYECKRTKSGKIQKGQILQDWVESLDHIVWDMATGQGNCSILVL